MSRDLKFRVWDLEAKRYWLTKDNLHFYLENLQDERLAVSISTFIKKSDRFVVQQYIGLQDKNEKDIYEGDIINVPAFCLYKVIWDDKYARFDLEQIEFDELYYGFDVHKNGWPNNLEIIGNIFENPELLK